MSSDPVNRALLRQAMEAAREGDREAARQLLEEVLEDDDENVTAWLLLARITQNTDERRMALTTVMQLDPGNEQAQKMLDRIEAREAAAREEIMAGVSRRQLRLILGGVTTVIVVIVIIGLAAIINRNQQAAERAQNETATVTERTHAVERATATGALTVTAVANARATQFAITSPTPTNTATRSGPTLPPTFTPSATAFFGRPTSLPAPPPAVSGALIGWSGRDLRNVGYLPIVRFPFSQDATPAQIADMTARHTVASPDGQQIAFTRYESAARVEIGLVGRDGTPIELSLIEAAQVDPFDDPKMPDFAAEGSHLVFIAEALDTSTDEVFMVPLEGGQEDAPPVIRLTNDGANYSFPAVSPDSSQIAVVRDDGQGGVDLVLINITSRTSTPLTSDQSARLETTPRWSPNGSLIAYAAATPEDRNNHDIFLIAPDGSRSDFQPFESEADDIYPVFSPDGSYLAFASDLTGDYDIFIFDLSGREMYQLTNSREADFPGSWINE